MKRIALTDDTGGWFDAETAIEFKENAYWNGRNKVSRATGCQWEHEELYYTRRGQWVLNRWGQWEGSGPEVYEQIDADQAARWLIRQDCLEDEAYQQLPEAVRAEVAEHVEAAEV